MLNKKNGAILFIAGAALVALGTVTISKQSSQEVVKPEAVQGIIGANLTGKGSIVCVNQFLNTTQKAIDGVNVEDELVAKLNQAGYNARKAASKDEVCENAVYGEIISIKGKNRIEAEVDFRLVKQGKEMPVLSSNAKGKSSEIRADAPPLDSVTNSLVPKSRRMNPKDADTALATREALAAAFENVARQIQQQRP